MIPQSKHRILWAQKSSSRDIDRNFCLLTLMPSTRITTHNVKVQLADDGLKMRAEGLHVDLQLFGAIDSAIYRRLDRENSLEVLLHKKEMSDEGWPRLLKPNPNSSFDFCESSTITPYKNIVDHDGEALRDRLCKLRIMQSDNIDGHSTAGREEVKLLPYGQRPVDFDDWLAHANRTVELRNFEESELLRLPRELRDEIWKFALVDEELVRMFDRLLPYAEDQFARGLSLHGNQVHLAAFQVYRERCRIYTRSKTGRRVVNFFTKPPSFDRGVGLFTTSRAVSRESLEVLYRKTRFIFPDQYGIVGARCFLNTIGKLNISNLRKISIHMPPWNFPQNSDRQRAGWIYQSAKAHGLQSGKKPRDPLLSSFVTTLTAVLKIERLRELDIGISPFVTHSFVLDMRIPAPDDVPTIMNRRISPKYLTRSEAEFAMLRRLKDATHRVHVRFVALEYTTTEFDFPYDQEMEDYWNMVQERCMQWGFDYVRVQSFEEEPSEQQEEGEVDE